MMLLAPPRVVFSWGYCTLGRMVLLFCALLLYVSGGGTGLAMYDWNHGCCSVQRPKLSHNSSVVNDYPLDPDQFGTPRLMYL